MRVEQLDRQTKGVFSYAESANLQQLHRKGQPLGVGRVFQVRTDILDQLASETQGRLKIVKVNVDENPRMAGAFQVQAIPTMVVLDRGQKRDEIRGALPKAALRARLDRLL